jgi:putative AlgH/UPF0301 family transcriptional regulator
MSRGIAGNSALGDRFCGTASATRKSACPGTFGYAGWGPDQLEHEIEQRAWGIAEADPTLVFDEDRDNVWEDAWKHRTDHF